MTVRYLYTYLYAQVITREGRSNPEDVASAQSILRKQEPLTGGLLHDACPGKSIAVGHQGLMPGSYTRREGGERKSPSSESSSVGPPTPASD